MLGEDQVEDVRVTVQLGEQDPAGAGKHTPIRADGHERAGPRQDLGAGAADLAVNRALLGGGPSLGEPGPATCPAWSSTRAWTWAVSTAHPGHGTLRPGQPALGPGPRPTVGFPLGDAPGSGSRGTGVAVRTL